MVELSVLVPVEFDLLAKVVVLVAGCHDGDCTLLDLHIDFVALECRQVAVVLQAESKLFASTRTVYFCALVFEVVVNSTVLVPEVEC